MPDRGVAPVGASARNASEGSGSVRLRSVPSGRFVHDVVSWANWTDDAFGGRPSLRARSRSMHHRIALARRHGLRSVESRRLTSLQLAGLLLEVGRLITRDDGEHPGIAGARFIESVGLHEVACLVANLDVDAFRPIGHRSADIADGDLWRQVDRELLAILSYVEITTDADGSAISLPERRLSLIARHGIDSPEVSAFDARIPEALEGQRMLTSGRFSQAS